MVCLLALQSQTANSKICNLKALGRSEALSSSKRLQKVIRDAFGGLCTHSAYWQFLSRF